MEIKCGFCKRFEITGIQNTNFLDVVTRQPTTIATGTCNVDNYRCTRWADDACSVFVDGQRQFQAK